MCGARERRAPGHSHNHVQPLRGHGDSLSLIASPRVLIMGPRLGAQIVSCPRADRPRVIEGGDLRLLIKEVRREFFARAACETFGDTQQINSVRVVAIEVFDGLSVEAQLAVVADLVRVDQEPILHRSTEDIFAASDSPLAFIADLVCEVVWQVLMDDPVVPMENEEREPLAS